MPRRKIDWYGPRLRQLREAAGLSQAELGKRVNVAGSQINKLETNVNQPTLATALAIADALGVAMTDFVSTGQSAASEQAAKSTRGRPLKATPAPPPAEELEATAKKPRERKRKGK